MYVSMSAYMCGKNQIGAYICTTSLGYDVTYSFNFLETIRIFLQMIIIVI